MFFHWCRPGCQQGRLPNTFPPSRHTRQGLEQPMQRHRGHQHHAPFPARHSQSAGDKPDHPKVSRPASSPERRGNVAVASMQQVSLCRAGDSSMKAWHGSGWQEHGPKPPAPGNHDRFSDVSLGRSSSTQLNSHDRHQHSRQGSHQGVRTSLVRAGNSEHAVQALRQQSKEARSSMRHLQKTSAQLRQALQQGRAGTVAGTLKRRSKPARPGAPGRTPMHHETWEYHQSTTKAHV